MFADWIHQLIGHTQIEHTAEYDRFVPGVGVRFVGGKTRQGSLTTSKVRVVCKTCNERWMSQIEEVAKPIMTPLIMGEATSLTADDQKRLGEWLTLKCIVGELADKPYMHMITDDERKQFYQHRRVMNHWRLFIGYFEGRLWRLRRFHAHWRHGGRYQATTLGIGHLFLHAMSGTGADRHATFSFPESVRETLQPICLGYCGPVNCERITWPRTPKVTDDAGMLIADGLYRWLSGTKSVFLF